LDAKIQNSQDFQSEIPKIFNFKAVFPYFSSVITSFPAPGTFAVKPAPVNDMAYFVTLLRYIHQNPVKAGIVTSVKDYNYSSWGEYNGQVEPVFRICDTRTVLNRIPFTDLDAIVNEQLPEDFMSLDDDNEQPRFRLSDDQVWQQIINLTKVTTATEFQLLDKDQLREALRELRLSGASVRQLERLTGISRGIIQAIKI